MYRLIKSGTPFPVMDSAKGRRRRENKGSRWRGWRGERVIFRYQSARGGWGRSYVSVAEDGCERGYPLQFNLKGNSRRVAAAGHLRVERTRARPSSRRDTAW